MLLLCAIGDYRDRRVNDWNLKPSTQAEYTRHLDALETLAGHVEIDDLNERHIAAFLGSCSPGSLPSRFSVLAAFLRWAHANGWGDLARLVPERRPARRWRTRHLAVEQVRGVLAWLDWYEGQPRSRRGTVDALRLAVLVPLRRGEVASLRFEEVDIDAGFLHLHDTKSGNRSVPLPRQARALVRRRLLQATPWLFPARSGGGHIAPESLSHAWCRVARANGLHGVPLHTLRHTWASQAIKAGVSLEYVRRILGHTTEWMSVKYAHVGTPELAEAAQRVESLLTEEAAE